MLPPYDPWLAASDAGDAWEAAQTSAATLAASQGS